MHREQAKWHDNGHPAACHKCSSYHHDNYDELYDYWETKDQGLVLGARFLWWQDPSRVYCGAGFNDTRKLLAFEVMYNELGMPCWEFGGEAYYTTAYDSADKEVKEYTNKWVTAENPKISSEHVHEAETRYMMFPFWNS